jgi:hypothetical protein
MGIVTGAQRDFSQSVDARDDQDQPRVAHGADAPEAGDGEGVHDRSLDSGTSPSCECAVFPVRGERHRGWNVVPYPRADSPPTL